LTSSSMLPDHSNPMMNARLHFHESSKRMSAGDRWAIDAVEALLARALHRPALTTLSASIARITRRNAVQLSTLLSIKTGGCPGRLRVLSASGALSHRCCERSAQGRRGR
jgi:hypothetical protein